PLHPMSPASRVALITGASSGIGAAVALLFARHGYSLSLSGRNVQRLAATADLCRREAGRLKQTGSEDIVVMETVGDLAKPECLTALAEATGKQFGGRLDSLINNAGILEYGSIENSSTEQLDRVLNINLRSVYRLTQLCLPLLKSVSPKGSIVNVSSVNGLRSFPGLLAYNVSKAALDQFTRCAALELAPVGIRCNSVNPGVIVTELQKTGGLSDEQYASFIKRCAETHALGRPGQPNEVAEAALFLADPDRSGFITGVTLPVDGGRHAMCPR
ncbi:hypothetical protein BOX15_Mlig020905g1, partial [Macrostomum lignano]